MSLFTALTAKDYGVGPYRINRFRTYFRPLTDDQRRRGYKHNRPPEEIAKELATDFTNRFPHYFNPNLATLERRDEHYNSTKAYRFVLSAGLFGSDHPVAQILAPDCHADWVGIHHKHDRGFTVQTLKREFFTGLDAYMAVATTGGATAVGAGAGALGTVWGGPLAALGAGGGAIVGFGAGLVGSAAGAQINRYHFLAGRRSWVFGSKAQFGMHRVSRYDNIPDDAIVFETAACERLSSYLFKAADLTRILGSFDRAIHRVWVKLMRNYIEKQGFEAIPVMVWMNQEGPVSFTETRYGALASCQGSTEYKDMILHHRKLLD